MSRYRLSALAKYDLQDIRDYLAQRGSRKVAAKVLREIRAALERLADMPGLGHVRPDLAKEPTRFYRVYNYLIVYRPDVKPLAVARILHGARGVRSILARTQLFKRAACEQAGSVPGCRESVQREANMDESRFWRMIEEAWQVVDGTAAARRKLAAGRLDEDAAMELAELSVDEFVPTLRSALQQLPRDELLAFDRILERMLYDIDRSDIQEHTDGSDDGFLYARGFIVAAGKAYYDAVSKDPSRAMMDLECEEMCYLPLHVFEEKFGRMPGSGISRETGSNEAGWANADG